MISSYKLLYADDVKLGRVIDGPADCQELQLDLLRLVDWCGANQLTLNADKCSVLTISNKTMNNTIFDYTLPGAHELARLTSVKDLGVYVDCSLRFHVHIEALVNKAFRALGFVMRTSRNFRHIESILHLYRHLVLPHLEYACTIWSPHYLVHVDAVEAVQRRFTRFVFRKFGLQYCDYHTRARRLKLLTLAKRRVYHDQMLLYKIVNGHTAVSSSALGIGMRTSRSTRNCDLFVERTWRLQSTHNAPVPRMLRFYNRHQSQLFDIFSDSIGDYKSKLLGLLWQLPDLV